MLDNYDTPLMRAIRQAEIGAKIFAGIILGATFFIGFTMGFAACVFL